MGKKYKGIHVHKMEKHNAIVKTFLNKYFLGTNKAVPQTFQRTSHNLLHGEKEGTKYINILGNINFVVSNICIK